MTEIQLAKADAEALYAVHFAGNVAPFTGSQKMVQSYELSADGVSIAIGLGGSIEDCRRSFPAQLDLPAGLDELCDDSMCVDLTRAADGARYSTFNEPW